MASLLCEAGHEIVERDPDYGLAQLVFAQIWVRGVHEDATGVPAPDTHERSTPADGGRRSGTRP